MISNNFAPQHILIIDDHEETLESTKLVLETLDYKVTTLLDPTQAITLLDAGIEDIDIVITDLNMPRLNGEELTSQISTLYGNLPIIVYTGNEERETNKRLLDAGAWDYVEKGTDWENLLCSIDKVWSHAQKRRGVRARRLIFRDDKMKRVTRMIGKLAEIPSPVLIQGEPGTGKELIAHEIHSKRLFHLQGQGVRVTEKDYPYLAVNCGALSRTLLESQLFGHKKGAFTGSVADQDGVFVAAGKGTLFLDEITELDLDLQVKLLRALQEKEVTPVGSNQPVPVHARVVTATNRPIQQLVQEGKFREDLFYRINVVNLEIPPLRERKMDVIPLAQAFLTEIRTEYNCAERELTEEASRALTAYDWPGNVRELHNCIERSFALGGHPTYIRVEDFPPEIVDGTVDLDGSMNGFREANERMTHALGQGLTSPVGAGRFQTYDELVAEHIRAALKESRGVKSRAATLLSIDRNRLYRLMDKYQIQT
ncbi:hypothetical protein CBD41_05760 [bacterium TMED181]|nr:hypothetical protein [Planctomycetota bacterium]OUW44455.1 MAG: hypothetical protein CBD41_05760 [bacterium TMED181]